MPDSPIDNRTLLRRTLITMGAMVGACVLLVGTLTLVAVFAVGRATPHESDTSAEPTAAQAKPAALTPTTKTK
jgi:hypothetical protein